MGPKLFMITEENPDLRTTRTLILVAKILQNLANMVEFSGTKEPYMEPLNDLVISNMDRVKKFIDELANPQQNNTSVPITKVYLEKELAGLYRCCKKNKQELYTNATQASEIEVVKRLDGILSKIEAAEQQEKLVRSSY